MADNALIHIRISPRAAALGVAGILLCSLAYEVISESMTLTTYYPSPVGVYKKMSTTSETKLATGDGNVTMVMGGGGVGIGVPAPLGKLHVAGDGDVILNPNGNIGIGTDTPAEKLDVDGVASFTGVKLGVGGTCDSSKDGTIAYRDSKVHVCNGDGSWLEVDGGQEPFGEPGSVFERQGNNPVCPEGTTSREKYWDGRHCSERNHGSQCRPHYAGRGCTTQAGWTTGHPQCTYGEAQFAGRHGCRVNTLTCIANSWSRIICVLK